MKGIHGQGERLPRSPLPAFARSDRVLQRALERRAESVPETFCDYLVGRKVVRRRKVPSSLEGRPQSMDLGRGRRPRLKTPLSKSSRNRVDLGARLGLSAGGVDAVDEVVHSLSSSLRSSKIRE